MANQIPNGFTYKNLLTCAGRQIGGVSICKGDSGSSLLLWSRKSGNKGPHYYVIGITQGTYNIRCDIDGEERYPGIYTRTENIDVHNFIRKTIGLNGKITYIFL